ncbi:MAG: hypothetical protein GFGODING_02121 [Flavobacteriales bacterium]|nr:hypothetical protein [Flavobacteriales bacterium]
MNGPVLLGAPGCVTPLGASLEETFTAMQAGRCGLRPEAFPGSEAPVHVGRCDEAVLTGSGRRAQRLLGAAVRRTMGGLARSLRTLPRTAWVLATTKGDVRALEEGRPDDALLPLFARRAGVALGLPGNPVVVSNACISGTLAVQVAADMVRSGEADHVLVAGMDEATDFVLSGFHCLHAIASGPCRPFDDARDGISLGEAAASVVVTRDASLFRHGPIATYLGGAMGNDANHISGPSRTGEGLVRAVESALREAALAPQAVTHVNAHGTGSVYNDGMEHIAFTRLGLGHAPVNSYKGYFGHTLGAAGLLESLVAVHALRQGLMLRSLGATGSATLPGIDVLHEHRPTAGRILLKTSSGFGGCNAAILLHA